MISLLYSLQYVAEFDVVKPSALISRQPAKPSAVMSIELKSPTPVKKLPPASHTSSPGMGSRLYYAVGVRLYFNSCAFFLRYLYDKDNNDTER